MRNLKCPFSHNVFWGARKLVNLDLTCPVLYAPICVLEEKDRKSKAALKNMLRKFFGGNFIVDFAFKVTAHDYP